MELLPPGAQLHEKQQEFEKCKEKYEKWKCDVSIKMKFLDENQVRRNIYSNDPMISYLQTKVMKKQLLLFHNAIAAYFSGNQEALEATMKQFNLKTLPNGNTNAEKKSFLEQLHS